MSLFQDPTAWNELSIQSILLSGLSVFSLTFTLYCFFRFKELQTDSFRLVSNILIFDLVYSLIIFWMSFAYQFEKLDDTEQNYLSNRSPILCQFEAYLSNFSIIGSCFWTSIVCHSLYCDVMNNPITNRQLIYGGIGYLLPATIAIMLVTIYIYGSPVFIDGYGTFYPMPQTNCYINANSPNYGLYSFLFFYFPVELAFIFNIFVIVLVIVKLKSILGESLFKSNNYIVLFLYPSILFVCWILPAIFQETGVQQPDFLFYIFYGFGALIGFLDSICYSYFSINNTLNVRWCKIEVISNSCEEMETQEYLFRQNSA